MRPEIQAEHQRLSEWMAYRADVSMKISTLDMPEEARNQFECALDIHGDNLLDGLLNTMFEVGVASVHRGPYSDDDLTFRDEVVAQLVEWSRKNEIDFAAYDELHEAIRDSIDIVNLRGMLGDDWFKRHQ